MLAALEQQAKGPAPESAPAKAAPASAHKQPGRAGKVNVTGYFAPSVKSSFRMIQTAHPEKTIQGLLTEALNDLFAKYNVPQTAHLEK
jgi:hypothetical protein